MPTSFPPLVIPPRRGLVHPMRRPFNVDKDCVLCLLPEINSTWIDYSGRGNDGTINGATLMYNGRRGPCLYFDGVDNSVNLGTPANLLALTMPLTYEIWVNFSSIASSDILIDFKVTDVDSRIAFGHSTIGDAIYIGVVGNSVGLNDVSLYITVGKWQHWVVLCHGVGDQSLYLDGVEQTLEVVGSRFGTDALTIGARDGGRDLPFQGYIDEVRIYDRVLAAWEIQALYEQGKPG